MSDSSNLHYSILSTRVGNQYSVLQCMSATCEPCLKRSKGQYHCPLCSLIFPIPSRLKTHYNKVHWDNRITAQGYNILRCGNECVSVGPRKGEATVKGAHFHCFGCTNIFRTERAKKHYCQHQHTAPVPAVQPSPAYQDHSRHHPHPPEYTGQHYAFQHLHTTPIPAVQPSPTYPDHSRDHPDPPEYTGQVTLTSIAPNRSGYLRGVNVDKVTCQYCSKNFHPHSLKTHIDSQHSSMANVSAISPYRYHKGVCVDAVKGVYFLRRNLSGPSYPVHVQYSPNGDPPKVMCQLTECQQVMDTAARSGDVAYLCRHLMSVPYIPTQLPTVRPLSSSSLDYLINDVKFLKPSSKMECLEYQLLAIREEAPLIVPLPVEETSPSRLSFSVWVKERKRWWSFCNRVTVTFDCQQKIWYCKHVKGSQSCIHKTIVKWYMAEHMPQLLGHAQTSVDEDGDVDDEVVNGIGDNEVEEVQSAAVQSPSSTYPPNGHLLKEMTRYIYHNKRIPVDLDINLLCQKDDYPKRLFPLETQCQCSSALSDPVRYTTNAKLLTTGAQRLIEGVEVYIRICPKCSMPYRYQEYSDGIHNYNDYWFFSLGVLELLRQLFKVHTATSRVTEALENWLRLKKGTLPHSTIRNAYLHFEALSNHSYDFTCVLCGHHPPALVLDANKKGAFDLSVSNLDVPEDNCDQVDSDAFWENVGFALVVRGFFHSGQSDSNNLFATAVMPNYKSWSPWVGKNTRVGKCLYNTEYKKCFHKRDLTEKGTSTISLEEVMEILDGGSVKVLRELCSKMEIAAKGSKKDLIRALKEHLEIPEEFLKIFSKFWGGSGGWLGAACQHGVCYGLKWLLRQEGARDHVDLIMSMKHQPNIIIVDFANTVAAHGNNRKRGLFSPNDGRVLPGTPQNIALAEKDDISIDMPWISAPSRSRSGFRPQVTAAAEQEQGGREPHPVTGSSLYLSLFDTFHEENSSNPVDLLRRTRCVKQLEGTFRTEVMEQLNNLMNKNNYFINSMSPVNAIFMQRLAIHLTNEKRNEKFISLHEKQLGKSVTINEDGQIVIRSMYQPRVVQQQLSSTPTNCVRVPSTSVSTVPPTSSTLSALTSTTTQPVAATPAPTVPVTSTVVSGLTSTPTSGPTAQSTSSSTPSPINHSAQPSCPVSVQITMVQSGVTQLTLPGQYCQSKLLGRSGSNACTIISLLAAIRFLKKQFYCTPSSEVTMMIKFISIMVDGNCLYDSLVPPQRFLDVDEAIKVLGLDNEVSVDWYEGVVDIPQFTALCKKFYDSGGAHIFILPPDTSVLVLAHTSTSLTFIDSHAHGNDGALSFSATCPETFASYVQRFVKSNSHQTGILGTNVFSIGLRM